MKTKSLCTLVYATPLFFLVVFVAVSAKHFLLCSASSSHCTTITLFYPTSANPIERYIYQMTLLHLHIGKRYIVQRIYVYCSFGFRAHREATYKSYTSPPLYFCTLLCLQQREYRKAATLEFRSTSVKRQETERNMDFERSDS